MIGTMRRNQIIDYLTLENNAVSGNALSEKFNVSRQVIVQDIALLRAEGYPIISTNKGYLYAGSLKKSRIFKVCHSDEEIADELNTIVDFGGTVIDVFVNHKIYGRMTASLNINSRLDVLNYLDKLDSGSSTPLKNVTSGYHYHTVEAASDEILDKIEKKLSEKQYLIEKDND